MKNPAKIAIGVFGKATIRREANSKRHFCAGK